MTELEKLISTLHDAGMRVTPQRRAICRYLSETEAHPTAAMIYEALKPEMPSLSLMTVYNTLNALVEVGALQAIGQAGDDTVHYDMDTEPHVNVVCTSCGKIVDIASEKMDALEREIAARSGFSLHQSKLLFEGLCPECQNEK